MDIHDEGVARALDAIRSGGEALVVITRQRIAQALDSLDEGDFAGAVNHLTDALQCVTPLQHASHYVAIADDSRLVPAKDLQVGMVMTHVGEVTEVEVEKCASELCQQHIKVKIGEHDMEFRGDQVVYVKYGTDEQ